MKVKNQHIVVVGAARSGAAVAELLQQKGGNLFVSDSGPIEDSIKKRLTRAGISFEENGHTGRARKGDWIVVSPGVPTKAPIVQYYLEKGKRVFSEMEVASWYNRSPVIAVTGSNGKTTVTSWLSHTWKTAGRDHILAGNIGYAFSDKVLETAPDKEAILEVSSFQLDHIDRFQPHISLILNITPDHLDRYQQDIEQYASAKFRITENQTENDWFIYNREDTRIRRHAESLRNQKNSPHLLAFSDKNELEQGAFIRDDQIILNLNNKEEVLMPTSEVKLDGRHNLNNGLATALAARASEIKNDAIRESLRSFEGVEHRLELVRTVEGVKYINDSKATNINAVWYALDSFNVPIVLILGGRDKGNNYMELATQIRKKVHTIVAIGEARPKIKEQLEECVPDFFEADTLKEAVKHGRKKAKRGEIVLLSPACASFDMFDSYEHRGKVFKEEVNKL